MGRRARPQSRSVSDSRPDPGRTNWFILVDETRQLYQMATYADMAEYVRRSVDRARINPWPGEPPLLLVESRSLGGVLRATTGEYLVAIAATNGQTGGFLHTEVAPILAGNDRVVLYLGDWDLQGPPDRGEHAERSGTCGRPAVRPSQLESGRDHRHQVRECGLAPVWKVDNRHRPARDHEAWEAEALGQGTIQQLVRDALDALLPEPLDDVLEREAEQRVRVAELLDGPH